MTGVTDPELITHHSKTTDPHCHEPMGCSVPASETGSLEMSLSTGKDNHENRSNWRYWTHWIEACQKASGAWARSRGRIAQNRRQQRYRRGTRRRAERRLSGRRCNELPFMGGRGRAEVL